MEDFFVKPFVSHLIHSGSKLSVPLCLPLHAHIRFGVRLAFTAAVVSLFGIVLHVAAVPEMPITFFGRVYWGSDPLDRSHSNHTVSVSKGTNVLASYVLGTRATDDYILEVPFTKDLGTAGWANPGDVLSFAIDGVRLPLADRVLTNVPGEDVQLDLHAELVQLAVSSAHGSATPAWTNSYLKGSTLFLSAPPVLVEEGGLRHRLTGFQGAGSVPTSGLVTAVNITLTNDSFIVWTWTTHYQLASGCTPESGGSITAVPGGADGYYPYGSTVDLLAVPRVGYLFDKWTGDAAGTATACVVHVLGPRTATARFLSDADLDRLPDEWELVYFGSISASNAAATVDVDGDGAINREEEIAGTDPRDHESRFRMTGASLTPDGDFRITWRTAQGRVYRIETSTSPVGPWNPHPNRETVFTGTGSEIHVIVNGSHNASFFRIQVAK